MRSGKTKRSISAILVLVLLLSALLPVTAYAADEQTSWDVEQDYEEALAPGQEDIWAGAEEELPEKPFDEALPMEEETPAAETVADYATFLSGLKLLEGYAQTYAEENAGENVNALIINFIRTGVERYTSGTWEMVCGKENTAFTAYVAEQDAANGTSASALKNIENFALPNGDPADLGHVFGAMDVANYAKVQ